MIGLENNSGVFLDPARMNVVYKKNNRFVLAINYSTCPERIALDSMALPSGSCAYIALLPLAAGEGDYVIDALSYGAVSFEVCAKEIVDLYNLFRNVTKIKTIYVCNALATTASVARVPTYESAVFYGNRVAVYSVEDKMLSNLEIYDSIDELYQARGDGFNCYGDVDLIDTNSLSSRYNELSELRPAEISHLACLFASYNTSFKIDIQDIIEDCMEIVEGKLAREVEKPVKPKELSEEEVQEVEKTADEYSTKIRTPAKIHKPERELKVRNAEQSVNKTGVNHSRRKPKFGAFGILPVLVSVCSCFTIGASIGLGQVTNKAVETGTPEDALVLAANAKQLGLIFDDSLGKCNYVSELYTFAKASGLNVTVEGFSSDTEAATVRAVIEGDDTMEKYIAYLETKYMVLSSDNLSITDGENGNVYETLFTLV